MKQLTVQEALAALGNIPQTKGNMVLPGTDMKARSKVLYFAGLSTTLAAKNGNVIDQQTLKAVGVTNSDGGNKLNKDTLFLATGIRILFDTTASVTIATAAWKSEAPPVFKNGEIVISQGSGGNLFECGVSPLAKYASSLSAEQEFFNIAPFLIRDGIEYAIQFLLCGNAAADQAYKIEISGYVITGGSLN